MYHLITNEMYFRNTLGEMEKAVFSVGLCALNQAVKWITGAETSHVILTGMIDLICATGN